MAITGPQLQTALGDTFKTSPRVLRELPPYGGTLQYWQIQGNVVHHGKCRKVATTASDNAATQAATVVAELVKTGNAP